jgi:hypothetical protein
MREGWVVEKGRAGWGVVDDLLAHWGFVRAWRA